MTIKSTLIYLIRLIALVILLTIGAILGGVLSGLSKLSVLQTPEEQQNSLLILLGIHGIYAFLISRFIVRSRWYGWRLILSVAILYFGITSLMPQLETLYFGKAMGIDTFMLGKILLAGFITTFIFAPASVIIFHKMKGNVTPNSPKKSTRENLRLKFPLLAVIYLILYLTFGYYVAWTSPQIRMYYAGNTDLLPFPNHILDMLHHDGGLIVFQLFRGFLWAGLVWLITRSSVGKKWETVLLAGSLTGLLLTVQLFLPNPFMPLEVRMIHFVETASSTFLFGMIAGSLLWSREND